MQHRSTVPHAHLVGIAGAGMRSLADVLLGMGWTLSGSDAAVGPVVPCFASRTRLFEGHAPEHVPPGTNILIYSSAVGADNPELLSAAELGIPIASYFQVLGRLMAARHGLAVAGTHGKSTTTAMAAHILIEAGLDPTVVFGACPLGAASGGRAGAGPLMLVEACEYRANFLELRPRQAAILGIEADHFDCYDSLEDVEHAFARFAALVPPDGMIIARHDCPATRRVIAGLSCPVETFSLGEAADWTARGLALQDGCYRFEMQHRGRGLGEVHLQVPGRCNVLNALAAAALARAAGAGPDAILRGLSGFAGLHRRLEVLQDCRGVAVVDDYAHHPTEVSAALEAVRQMFPRRRVWCVFQPHQVSRTARLLDELAASLQHADRVLVAEIFRAREGPARPGEITAADLARRVRAGGVEVSGVGPAEDLARWLEDRLEPGDVLVTMGAGDIGWIFRNTRLFDKVLGGPAGRTVHGYLERFREDRAAG